MSITDELREYTRHYSVALSAKDKMLTAIADRIDAEHERACKESYASGAEHGIDASIEVSMIEDHGWVRLPKDADGEYIHIGDVMKRMERCGKVVALHLSDNPWGDGNRWAIQLEGENAPTVLDAFFRHHKPHTVEDVLREFAEKVIDSQIPSVHPTYEEAIAEYTAKLRLAESEEE